MCWSQADVGPSNTGHSGHTASPGGLANLLQMSLQGLAPRGPAGGQGWRRFQVTRAKALSCSQLPAGRGQQGKADTSFGDMWATLLGSVPPEFLGRVPFLRDKADSGDRQPADAAQPHHIPAPGCFLIPLCFSFSLCKMGIIVVPQTHSLVGALSK